MGVHKSLFVKLLLLLSILLVPLLFYLGYYFISPDSPLFQYALAIIIVIAAVVVSAVFLASLVLLYSLAAGQWPSFITPLVEKSAKFLYPIIYNIGKILGIAQDKIQRSFIEMNNKLVEARKLKTKPGNILILLPHCLQNQNCPHKITKNPFNCRNCGRCTIGELLQVAERWKVKVEVITGGTLARKSVRTHRPHYIVAAACERDLSSGIMDSFPLPVQGLLLDRPFGPCFNTHLSVEELELTLRKLVNKNFVVKKELKNLDRSYINR